MWFHCSGPRRQEVDRIMSRQITLGVVGVGNVFGLHLQAINADQRFKVVAACDNSPERLERLRLTLGARPFGEYHQMLATDFDVLVICLPHHLHAPVTVEALRCGKHVLVEKPMATSLEQCRQMLQASHETRCQLLVAEVASFDPGAVLTGRHFRTGNLGGFFCSTIVNIRDYFNRDRPAWYLDPSQSGGGMFANVGVHRLALVRAALPTLTPRFVTASVSRLPAIPVEACTHAMVQYDEGGAVTYEQVGYFQRPSRLQDLHHFVFEEGIASWNSTSWELVRGDGKPLEEQPLVSVGVPYAPVYNGLIERIEGHSAGPGARDSASDIAIAHAIYQSAASNSRIDLRSVL